MDTTATVTDALDWAQTELTGSPEKAPAAVMRLNECLGNMRGVLAGTNGRNSSRGAGGTRCSP